MTKNPNHGWRLVLGVLILALFPRLADSGIEKAGQCYVLAIGVNKYNKVNSIVLTDDGATREAIEGAMRRDVTETRPDNTFVFFFSGLSFIPSKFAKSLDLAARADEFYLVPGGVPEAPLEQQRGFVITKDSKREDPNHNTQIPQSDLREIVDSIPARHIFVVMDVCFGAAFDPSMGGSMHRGSDEYGKISGRELLERKLSLATRQFLTSGSKEYVPDGRPGQNSPFARAFLEALRTYGGPDGLLTLARLRPHFELLKTVPRMGDFGHDEPGSEFFLIADPKLRSAALATEAGRRWQP